MMRDKRGNLPISDRLRRCRDPAHAFDQLVNNAPANTIS